MSELQIGLLVIGGVVVAGVLGYNRIQERKARRDAERAFGSMHADALMDAPAANPVAERGIEEPVRAAPRHVTEAPSAAPDPAVDYIIEFSSSQPGAPAHDDCSLCFSLYVAGNAALPVLAPPVAPSAATAAAPSVPRPLRLASTPYLLFRTRAPPVL